MSKLDELEKLAEAASVLDHNECHRWYSVEYLLPVCVYPKNAKLLAACDPQTIKDMIALMRQMAQNLDYFGDKYGFESVALRKFKEWGE